MKRAAPPPRVAILGCGRVGRALALELLERGERMLGDGVLRVWSRSSRGVRELRALVRNGARRVRALERIGEATAGADVLLLCVADDALDAVVGRLARTRAARERTAVLLMTSGFVSLAALAPLARLGWAVGRIHPLAPVPAGAERTAPLYRSRYALEGDARALRTGRRIVRGIRGVPFELTGHPGAAEAYHAGASLLSGGLVALFHLGERVMAGSFRAPVEVRPALAHLLGNTLGYAASAGPERALTGALSRGSEAVVRGHLRALAGVPEALELYCSLGRTMLALARARSSLDARTERRLRGLLGKSAFQR